MAQPQARIATLFSALMCCALIALPATSEGQTTAPPPPANPSAATAPATAAPETIEVEAPRLFKFETQTTNGTLQKASLEGPVSYADLDLRTDEGVVELRSRIAHEAADICAHLAQLYPVYAAAGTSCVKDAIEDGTIRANRVIRAVRQPTY